MELFLNSIRKGSKQTQVQIKLVDENTLHTLLSLYFDPTNSSVHKYTAIKYLALNNSSSKCTQSY